MNAADAVSTGTGVTRFPSCRPSSTAHSAPQPAGRTHMKAWLALTLGLGLLSASAAASAHDYGDRVEHRMDRKGDRIEHRLDRKGDRIDARLDHRAARAAAHGHYGRAYHLDRKGD